MRVYIALIYHLIYVQSKFEKRTGHEQTNTRPTQYKTQNHLRKIHS